MLTLLIVLDMILAAQLNGPYTTYSDLFSAKASSDHLKKFPSGFPMLPDKNISDVDSREVYYGPFWKNVNIFQKLVSGDGFNSFAFTGYEKLRDESPQLYADILKNRIVFLSDKACDEKEMQHFRRDCLFTNQTLFFRNEDFHDLNAFPLKHSMEDRAILTYFSPDSFMVSTQTQEVQLLTLLQNNYTGWSASVNGKKAKIFTSNYSLMSIVLPPGKNTVGFIYENKSVKNAMYLSLLSLCSCLFILVLNFLRPLLIRPGTP